MEIRLNCADGIPAAVMRVNGIIAAFIKIAEKPTVPAAVNLSQEIERNIEQMLPDAARDFVSQAETRGVKRKQRAVCSAGTEADHHHPGAVHFEIQITVIICRAKKEFHTAVTADSAVVLTANAAERKFIGGKEN